jgi:hypothetical protein
MIAVIATGHANVSTATLRVRVEIMGSQKCRIVGESQPVLIMIDPMISTRNRMTTPPASARYAAECRSMICAGAGMVAPSDAVRGGVLRLGSQGLECVVHLRQAPRDWLRAY